MRHWLRGYGLILKWQALNARLLLPFVAIAQLFIGGGTVVGLGLLFENIDPTSAKYLTTGGATLALISLGMALLPQVVGQAKERKSFDYIWSLPLPRMAYLAADLTLWMLAILPGVAFALTLGSVLYGFDLELSPLVVPAVLIVALAASFIGNAIAHLSPSIVLTGVITNVIILGSLLFSPINYPADHLPDAIRFVHVALPVKYMADLIRGTVTTGLVENLGLAFAVVSAWALGGFLVSYAVVTRRA